MSQLHEEDDVSDGMTGGGLDCVTVYTRLTYNYHGAAATLGSTNYPTVPHILVQWSTSVIQMVVTNIILREGLVKGCVNGDQSPCD